MERAKQLMEMVAKYESLIYDTADYIWKNPETVYLSAPRSFRASRRPRSRLGSRGARRAAP